MIPQRLAQWHLKIRLDDLLPEGTPAIGPTAPPAWMISFWRWSLALGGLPFVLWALGVGLPERWVFEAGDLMNKIFWDHFKPISLNDCGLGCRDLVFGMVATPVVWALSVVAFFRFNFLSAQEAAWMESLERSGIRIRAPHRFWLVVERSTVWIVFGICSCAAIAVLSYCLVGVMSHPAPNSPPVVITRFWYAGLCAFLGLGIANMGWMVPRSNNDGPRAGVTSEMAQPPAPILQLGTMFGHCDEVRLDLDGMALTVDVQYYGQAGTFHRRLRFDFVQVHSFHSDIMAPLSASGFVDRLCELPTSAWLQTYEKRKSPADIGPWHHYAILFSKCGFLEVLCTRVEIADEIAGDLPPLTTG